MIKFDKCCKCCCKRGSKGNTANGKATKVHLHDGEDKDKDGGGKADDDAPDGGGGGKEQHEQEEQEDGEEQTDNDEAGEGN